MKTTTHIPTVIVKPQTIELEITGIGGMLMDKMPDMSISKSEQKNQVKEDPIEKENRLWRTKLYVEGTNLIVPGENLHECMKEAAKYWGMTIPGEGKKTYTDVIKSAVVVENIYLNISPNDKDNIVPLGKMVNGNPSKGKSSGCKVYKIRPLVQNWKGTCILHIFDARLTESVLRTILSYAGTFKGLCNWRPIYGRFEVSNFKYLS